MIPRQPEALVRRATVRYYMAMIPRFRHMADLAYPLIARKGSQLSRRIHPTCSGAVTLNLAREKDDKTRYTCTAKQKRILQ